MGSRMKQATLQAQGVAPPPVTAHPPSRSTPADVTQVKTIDESDEEDGEDIHRLEVRPSFLFLL
jgi:hypothetical protein